jgi:hypothetical protein
MPELKKCDLLNPWPVPDYSVSLKCITAMALALSASWNDAAKYRHSPHSTAG